MDFLQQNMAFEFGLSNLRAKHQGESSMGLRPPSERPMAPQEYMLAVAQGRAPMLQGKNGPVLGMWGDPTQIPNAQVTPVDQRHEPSPVDITKFANKPMEIDTPRGTLQFKLADTAKPVHEIRHKAAKEEVAKVIDMAKSPGDL